MYRIKWTQRGDECGIYRDDAQEPEMTMTGYEFEEFLIHVDERWIGLVPRILARRQERANA